MTTRRGSERQGRLVRALGSVVGRIGAAPLVALYRVMSRIVGEPASFRAFSETLSLIPGDLGVYVRRHAYRGTIARCGGELSVGFGTILSSSALEIGDDVYMGRQCLIAQARIGDGAMLADQVRVISGRHGMRPGVPMRLQASSYEPVEIGEDVWIGTGSTILAAIGAGAVVAAGTVVTKPVPGNVLAAGVPARVIRERT